MNAQDGHFLHGIVNPGFRMMDKLPARWYYNRERVAERMLMRNIMARLHTSRPHEELLAWAATLRLLFRMSSLEKLGESFSDGVNLVGN